MRALMLAAAIGLLTACATATPYQPTAANNDYGFTEQQIESNRVRISFRGNSVTDRETVETYLLYRASEVTLAGGYDYFVVATRDTEEHSRLQGMGPRGPYGYGFGYGRYYAPYYGYGLGYDPFWGDDMSYREVTRYEAVSEIAMFRGPKPADNADAFDAREVQANLQPRIVRPAPAS